MVTLENLKISLIDKINSIESEKILNELNIIVDNIKAERKVYLSLTQIEMIKLSEEDIKYGRTHSEEEIEELDSKWMD